MHTENIFAWRRNSCTDTDKNVKKKCSSRAFYPHRTIVNVPVVLAIYILSLPISSGSDQHILSTVIVSHIIQTLFWFAKSNHRFFKCKHFACYQMNQRLIVECSHSNVSISMLDDNQIPLPIPFIRSSFHYFIKVIESMASELKWSFSILNQFVHNENYHP